MRGNPQAASMRLLAVLPGERWTTWLEQTRQRRRRDELTTLEVKERRQHEERRAQRSGEHSPDLRRLR